MSDLVPFVHLLRGGTVECIHFGALAVTDARGRVLAHAGNPRWLAFTRSTLKALQVLPFLRAGGLAHFGLQRDHLALMCASHSGEPMHVQRVEAILARAGLTPRALQCGCHKPLFLDLGVAAPDAGPWDERHHNCSGKHAGFLAWCVQHGHPVGNYLAPAHPLQQAVRREVAAVAGLAPEALAAGTDGCCAPNYAMPLANLAWAWARVASGEHDPEYGEQFAQVADAMAAHPDLVSGTRRNDNAFMAAGRGDWLTKIGADGVQVVASRSRGQALALKIIDGNATAVHAATLAALDQLGWMDARQRDELRPWRAEAIANARGTKVGERKAVLTLQRGDAA